MKLPLRLATTAGAMLLLAACSTPPTQSAASLPAPPPVTTASPVPPQQAIAPPTLPPNIESKPPSRQRNDYIRSLAAAMVDTLPLEGKDDFGRVQAAYRHLVEFTYFAPPIGLDSWQLQEGDRQPSYLENRALSPLAYGIGSCEDYACAMVLLLEQMGFEAKYLPGITISVQGDFVDHAWAAVRLRGSWYHLDPQLEDNITKKNQLRYRYFLKTDEEMLVDHRWGRNLIEYAELTEAQVREIEQSYLLPACDRRYPTPATVELAPVLRPGISRLVAGLAAERTAYEVEHGVLPVVELNIIPPVFGNEGYGPPD